VKGGELVQTSHCKKTREDSREDGAHETKGGIEGLVTKTGGKKNWSGGPLVFSSRERGGYRGKTTG